MKCKNKCDALSVVFETSFKTEANKFVGISYFDVTITVNKSVNHLADNVFTDYVKYNYLKV